MKGDWRSFGTRLKRVLKKNAAYAILDEYLPGLTWLEGGCRLLAEAIVGWGRTQRVRIELVSVCTKLGGEWIQDHVVARVVDEDVYIDADGARTEADLLRSWSKNERGGASTKLCPAVEHDGLIAGASPGYQHATKLAELILRDVGPL